ncbi:MAG: ABC transporter ATP-binding protein [Agathobacter sp.]|nr:ABC transporter ATP-binding protein [Agathobacter sp.]
MSIILEAKDISKTYKNGSVEVKALKPCSLTFKEGEFVSIVGKSGSGKSTLLKLLGTTEIPDDGDILLNGKSILRLKDKDVSKLRRSQIGFVYQDYSLLPEFTAYENIIFPIRLDGKIPEKDKIEELMMVLGILSCKDKFPGEMSGGEQQRVAIARAIAIQPAVILADEPTGNLDCENSNEVVTLMRKAAKMYHQTIIMVTHDMQTADYADRIIRIQDGEIS